MSDLVQVGLDAYLLAQTALTDELTIDEDGFQPIYATRRNDNPKHFPQVIFFEAPGGGPDGDDGYSKKMDHEFWHIQVWDNSRDPVRMKKIARIIKELLHEKHFPIPGSTLHYVEKVRGGETEGYDEQTKEHFNVQAFHIVHSPN